MAEVQDLLNNVGDIVGSFSTAADKLKEDLNRWSAFSGELDALVGKLSGDLKEWNALAVQLDKALVEVKKVSTTRDSVQKEVDALMIKKAELDKELAAVMARYK